MCGIGYKRYIKGDTILSNNFSLLKIPTGKAKDTARDIEQSTLERLKIALKSSNLASLIKAINTLSGVGMPGLASK
ncbi:MAG: hypothetical protein QXM06_02375 [Archaeoglobaceae archaeon]